MNKRDAYDRVKRLLQEKGFHFSCDDGQFEITGTFASEVYAGRLTRFKLRIYDKYIMNVTHWDICADGCIEKMACLIAALNSNLLCGNFELDVKSGEISYKNVMSLIDVEHWNYDELHKFILLPTQMFFSHSQQLQGALA